MFTQMPQRNVVSWTILISGYAQHGKLEPCFLLFSQMLCLSLSNCRPNDFTYASLLSACDFRHGIQVHGHAIRTGFAAWIYVANALLTMYWNDNATHEAAWRVFDAMCIRNHVTYNAMISGLGLHDRGDEAIYLFVTMLRDGIEVDHTTLLTLVSSSCGLIDQNAGFRCCLQLHSLGIKAGLVQDIGVVTALIKAYSTLGQDVDASHKLFLGTSSGRRDILLWTVIMTASVETNPELALVLFNHMRWEDFCPDRYVFSVLLKACANMVTERCTSSVHSQVVTTGFVNFVEISNALIHAYSRCGSIGDAEQVFHEMTLRDLVSWNTMLKACAVHGKAQIALDLFEQMNVTPDEATFIALLSSCSHAGMVKEGRVIFDSMYKKYGVVAQVDHYACMVDMLGRSGNLSEAANVINKMPMQPDCVVWSALLGACWKHGEADLANLASSKLKELKPESSLGYVLMSNIYCSAHSFDKGGYIRGKMETVGVRKAPGLSWTEVGHKVHEFASGGQRHPQLKAIRAYMEELLRELRKLGYAPDTSSVNFDIEEEHKEEQLYHHSEKLALVLSLMNCRGGSNHSYGHAIKIIKNIRICSDCHNFMRLASKLVGKAIIVRDANRFHHFSGGACSCNEYW